MVAIAIIMLPSGASHLHHPLFHEDLIDFHSDKLLCNFTTDGRERREVWAMCVCVYVCLHVCDLFTFYIPVHSKKNLQ